MTKRRHTNPAPWLGGKHLHMSREQRFERAPRVGEPWHNDAARLDDPVACQDCGYHVCSCGKEPEQLGAKAAANRGACLPGASAGGKSAGVLPPWFRVGQRVRLPAGTGREAVIHAVYDDRAKLRYGEGVGNHFCWYAHELTPIDEPKPRPPCPSRWCTKPSGHDDACDDALCELTPEAILFNHEGQHFRALVEDGVWQVERHPSTGNRWASDIRAADEPKPTRLQLWAWCYLRQHGDDRKPEAKADVWPGAHKAEALGLRCSVQDGLRNAVHPSGLRIFSAESNPADLGWLLDPGRGRAFDRPIHYDAALARARELLEHEARVPAAERAK